MPIKLSRKLLLAASLATSTFATTAVAETVAPQRVAAAMPTPPRTPHTFIGRALFRPMQEIAAAAPAAVQQPLLTSEGRPACSNMVSKRAPDDGGC